VMTPEEIVKVLREVEAEAKASEGDYYADQYAWHGAGEIADAVEQMAAEIARLREERRWVSVGERLPHVGPDEKVLVAWRYEDEPKESLVVSEAWHLRRGLFVDKEELEFPDVKFWQPLPTGPEGNA
jgi:hypothetical protein